MILVRLTFSLLVATLAATPVSAMYDKGSPVKHLTPSNFDRVLSKTSQPTFVEFYAPWCGHCKNLEPKYELAAKRTTGIAKFYAVDCDKDSNRGLCARFNVQGFPTIKVFTEKRTKRGNRKSIDYQGERSARAMARYARSALPNLSKKLADNGLDTFVTGTKLPKVVLLTERTKTSDFWKGINAQFDRLVEFAQISSPEKATLEKLSVTKLPAIVAFPNVADPGHSEAYSGEIKYQSLVKFVNRIYTGKKEPSGSSHRAAPTAKLEVREIASQSDLEELCIKADSKSAIPVLCIVGLMPLESEFQESRDEHAQALKILENVSNNQRMRSLSGHKESNDNVEVDDVLSDKMESEEQQGENRLGPPFRVSWVNALGASGREMRTLFNLSDDLPAVVAISPRKNAASPYMGPFDSTAILEWADACYQGHGLRRITSDLYIGVKDRAHDEL
ncbi:hypothetical protein IW140_001068 [Coemansia sp. RSA 1813]|nr:hypothetical protein EV178_005704 [Coemansia sp. RSA 1646]KAJ1773103.1 hypothetical protein LPJ74_000842 [Coemansia sp. RSA 1843]KAJ2085391.1 hypothetical protein IW138_006361 [Coemansia sp. RSA 986]KAJ2211177.1 hypothetical protein EV179_005717 [Coemansia sp. RSA 487]KAJ2572028.1 hypothetical protein IW140_001068 [Coemansia sp. RSA 1813]